MSENLEKDFIEDEHKETIVAKCKNCGGNTVFDPATQQLKCLFCNSLRDFSKNSNVQELDVEQIILNGETWDNSASCYRCDNCGAVVVLSPTETAKDCPYCGTSHIVKSQELIGLKPNAVYPFTVTKESCTEIVKTWAKKRLFISNKFKKSATLENLYGVYEPCFTYDSQTHSTYNGVIGIRRERVVGSGKNRRVVTWTEWRKIGGTYTEFFDDVMVSSGDGITQKQLNALLPYNFSTIKVYEQSYLTGFMAHKNNSSVKDGWEKSKKYIDVALRKNILSNYHYDVVDYLNVSTTHSGVTYKYVLLPIYHMLYKHKNKLFKVFVNGNTGKVAGKYPLSIFKILLAVLLGLGLIFLVGLLFYNYY